MSERFYTIAIGEQTPFLCSASMDKLRGMYAALMLLGANNVKLHSSLEIFAYCHARKENCRLSKDNLLYRYNNAIDYPMNYYRKWTAYDTRDSKTCKIISPPSRECPFIYLKDHSMYGLSGIGEVTHDFVEGVNFISSVTGLRSDYVFGISGKLSMKPWLHTFLIQGLPDEIIETIISYCVPSFYAVSKRYHSMCRKMALMSSFVNPYDKAAMILAILSGTSSSDETEQLVLSSMSSLDVNYIVSVPKISTYLYSDALITAHYNKIKNYKNLIGRDVIRSSAYRNVKYISMLITIGYTFDTYIYSRINDEIQYEENLDTISRLLESVAFLMEKNINIKNTCDVIPFFSVEVALTYYNKFRSIIEPDFLHEFISGTANACVLAGNIELLLIVSQNLSDENYVTVVNYVFDHYLEGHRYKHGIPTEDELRRLFSSPRFTHFESDLHDSNNVSVDERGIILGLLENPNFAGLYDVLTATLSSIDCVE